MSNIRKWRQRADGTDGGETTVDGWKGFDGFLMLLVYDYYYLVQASVFSVQCFC